MRGLCSASTRTEIYIQVWFRRGNNDKWTQLSWLNAEAITLLSNSGHFACFIPPACCHADFSLPQNTPLTWGWLRSSSVCLHPYALDQRLNSNSFAFCSLEAGGRRWRERQGPIHHAFCHQGQCPSNEWIIEFLSTNRILKLLHLELLS